MEMEAIYENIQEKNRNTVGLRTPTQNPTEAQSNSKPKIIFLTCVVEFIRIYGVIWSQS